MGHLTSCRSPIYTLTASGWFHAIVVNRSVYALDEPVKARQETWIRLVTLYEWHPFSNLNHHGVVLTLYLQAVFSYLKNLHLVQT